MLSPVVTYSVARAYVVQLFTPPMKNQREKKLMIYYVLTHRCLFALNPYICPLCRKKFEPNKAKKLHVDRPENVDENRENDLLQRLAVSWEAPEDQLRALTFEVDTWLDTRADDTVCVVLSLI